MGLLKNSVPKKIQIGIQDGYCNLRCSMCFLRSDERIDTLGLKGKMPFGDLCRILDELRGSGSAILPYRWSEPLMIGDFSRCITAIKDRGLSVIINTNGLLLTRGLAKLMVEVEFDSVTFSIDSTTNETYKKIRGVDALDKAVTSVFLMLEERGGSDFPRIGTSFVLGKENAHERDEFVSHWLEHVDVVRINKMYDFEKGTKGLASSGRRVPCYLLYDLMTVNHKGDVVLCCLDSLEQMNMGNVLRDGVESVWHGERFSEVRHCHEAGQYHKIPLCKDCPSWMNYRFKKSVQEGITVRESPVMTFYNRDDRLSNWNHE